MLNHGGTMCDRMALVMVLIFIFVSVTAESTHGCIQSHDLHGISVDCRNRHLKSIPSDLPQNTTRLDMSHNSISRIVKRFLHLPNLKYLDLSFNTIKILEEGAFFEAADLEELYLNNNELRLDSTTYPDDVFQPLQKLQMLHLHNNDPRSEGTYPEKAIAKLKHVQELKIDTFTYTNFGPGFSELTSLKRLVFGFSQCKLSFLYNDTFQSFQYNVLIETLDLHLCPLTRIGPNAFRYLASLKNLVLSNAITLTPTEAVSAMYGLRGKNLTSIKINHIFQLFNLKIGLMNQRILDKTVVANLKDVCVERFEMINCKLLWFDSSILVDGSTFASCIKVIDFSGNDWLGDPKILFAISLMPNLVSLNLSDTLSMTQQSTKQRLVEICAISFPTLGLTLPETLVYLTLSGKNFGCFSNVTIYNGMSMKYMSLTYAGLDRFSSTVRGLHNLSYLDISGNNRAGISSLLLASFPMLDTLIMSDANLDLGEALSEVQHGLSFLPHLHTLDVSSNNLRMLSVTSFEGVPLKSLILSNNRFSTIPFDLSTTPYLSHLDLSSNSIAALSTTEMKQLDALAVRNNLSLDLNGNLLSCGCKTLDFIIWLFKTNVRTTAENSSCAKDDGAVTNTFYIYEHYDEIWKQCVGGFWLSVSVVCYAVIVLVTIAIFVIYRRKTLLINIVLRMFGFKTTKEALKRKDFPNDAYIAYSENDYQYICHTVRDHLENQHGLKLFLKDRDTIPGGQIAEDIIDGIDSSWNVILALSQSFLEDQWCRFIVNRVVYSSSRMPAGSIVLVLFEDVRRADIPPTLLNVVEEKQIFDMEKYRGEEGKLWQDVCQCIVIPKDK
ncbi:toll-like receptor 2 [Haliotis rufescens]|uniref:toll-like receptor 2 n=1 Tax=Haliotis rufescens TaxID=6454 RepID=UPI00201EB6A3|nr:toll-like receptor 2 [Haliotis rufescens]